MQQQRVIAPLLPVAIAFILGIIVGRYTDYGAVTTLAILAGLIGIALCLFRFPKVQSLFILLITMVMGCHLIQHPLPDIPVVKRAGDRMLEYREQLLQQYRATMNPATYEVVAAMTLGDKTALTKETREKFNMTGASHILAISGLHLGIIYMMVSLLAWGRRWRIVAQVLTLVLLWGFAFLVGLPASVVRATTMLTIYGLLSLGYRQNSSLNVLAFTAIVILACHPEALFEVGFQMSYLAVFAILLFYPTLYGMISEKWLMEHRVVRWIWGMTTVSLCAQLGVGPLIAFYFHRFSTYFLLTNFIVIPCAYLILVGGFLLLLTSWTMIASALATVVTIMTQSLTAIAALPIASIGNLYPSLLQTVLVYVLIGCLSIIFLKLWQTYSVSYR